MDLQLAKLQAVKTVDSLKQMVRSLDYFRGKLSDEDLESNGYDFDHAADNLIQIIRRLAKKYDLKDNIY